MIPVGDSNHRHSTPWVTRLIILANIAVFLYMVSLSATPEVVAARTEELRLAEERTGKRRKAERASATAPTTAQAPRIAIDPRATLVADEAVTP